MEARSSVSRPRDRLPGPLPLAAAPQGLNTHAESKTQVQGQAGSQRAARFPGSQGRPGARGTGGSAGARGGPGPAGAAGPSDGYIRRVPAPTTVAAGVDTPLVQLTLPINSAYIVTAATELGNTSLTAGFATCTLLEGSNPIGAGSAEFSAQNVFAHMITLTGATSGGVVTLSCNPENAAQGRNNVITAIRVGTLHTQ